MTRGSGGDIRPSVYICRGTRMVQRTDLKSVGLSTCGFESRLRYHIDILRGDNMFRLIAAIKRFFKQRKCKHDYTLIRWRLIEPENGEPSYVKAEYYCFLCGKRDYMYLKDEDKKQWLFDMDDYKRG